MIHIDIVGPLPRSRRGYDHALTIMDRFTRWFTAIPCRGAPTADQCAQLLYKHWVSMFGIPDILVSDQGRQFEGILFQELMKQLGIDKRRTTAYHPQSNGMIERQHKTMKEALTSLCAGVTNRWEEVLPTVLLAMRTAINDLGLSPSLMVFGEQIQIPRLLVSGEHTFAEASPDGFVKDLMAEMTVIRDLVLQCDDTLKGPSDPNSHKQEFNAKWVWLKVAVYKGALRAKYAGPYEVISVDFPCVVIRKDGQDIRVNVDRVKPCHRIREFPVPPKVVLTL